MRLRIFSYRMPFCFNETHTDVTVFGNDHWFNDIDGGTVKLEPECNKEICPDSSGKVKKYVRIRDLRTRSGQVRSHVTSFDPE